MGGGTTADLDAELARALATSLAVTLPALVAGRTQAAQRSDRIRLLLQLSMRNVGSARIGQAIAARLDDSAALAQLVTLLGGEHEHWAQAALSLGVEDALTALDLCAAAAHILSVEPLAGPADRLWDIENLRNSRTQQLAPTHLVQWAKDVATRPEYVHLCSLRHALVHRDYSTLRGLLFRHDDDGQLTAAPYPATVTVWSSQDGKPRQRELRLATDLPILVHFARECVVEFHRVLGRMAGVVPDGV